MEEEQNHDYAYAPIDLSRLAQDQRKMMELNIRHMKRLMAPLKTNVKGDVQKRIHAIFDEFNQNEREARSPADKKKAPELSIKDKIKEITKISNSHDYGKNYFIKRSRHLEDPSKPNMRLDVLAMSKNYLEQKGYQELDIEFDLVKRHDHRKKTLLTLEAERKKTSPRKGKHQLKNPDDYSLKKLPVVLTSPRNFDQELNSFKSNINSLRNDANMMFIKGNPQRKLNYLRQASSESDAFMTPRQPSSSPNNFAQTHSALRNNAHKHSGRAAHLVPEKPHSNPANQTEYISFGKKALIQTPNSSGIMSNSIRKLGPMTSHNETTQSNMKMNISGSESQFMISPKGTIPIKEEVKEYMLKKTASPPKLNYKDRSTSLSKIEINKSKTLGSQDLTDLKPEVEELFRDFQSTLKKKKKKSKKNQMASIQSLEESELNQSIKEAIKHYYSPEKPSSKKEVSKKADSIVEKYGYQTYDNSEIINNIVSSNKYKGKTWEQIQYMNRIEKTEMYLKLIRAKKTKAVTVE